MRPAILFRHPREGGDPDNGPDCRDVSWAPAFAGATVKTSEK
jgi:hypothetical protein